MSETSKSDTEQSIQLKQIDLNTITKLSWIKSYRSNFASLMKDVNNLDNENYQSKINNVNYDLKSVEQFLLEIVTKKIETETRAKCTKT